MTSFLPQTENFFPLSKIASGIAACASLTELDFSFLELGEGTGLTDFTQALRNNTTITKITLFCLSSSSQLKATTTCNLTFGHTTANKFTPKHGYDLGLMMNAMKGLKTVDLSVNHLGDEGLGDICTMLAKNTTLESLCVGANNLTSAAGKSIKELLLQNTTLTSLNLIGLPLVDIPEKHHEPFNKITPSRQPHCGRGRDPHRASAQGQPHPAVPQPQQFVAPQRPW